MNIKLAGTTVCTNSFAVVLALKIVGYFHHLTSPSGYFTIVEGKHNKHLCFKVACRFQISNFKSQVFNMLIDM